MRAWILLALTTMLACGGKEEVGGTPVGTCTVNAGEWSCTAALADASGTWPQCAADVGAGASCGGTDTTTDTTNSTAPAHYRSSSPPCFTCTSNGLGVVWSCTSQVWEAGDVFSCGAWSAGP
jgi:hypothetical protein